MAKFEAAKLAAAIHGKFPLPVVVGAAIDDGQGGVFVQVGYAHIGTEDVEFIAATLLRDVLRQLDAERDEGCPNCRRRRERVAEAVAVLERGGVSPTGIERRAEH